MTRRTTFMCLFLVVLLLLLIACYNLPQYNVLSPRAEQWNVYYVPADQKLVSVSWLTYDGLHLLTRNRDSGEKPTTYRLTNPKKTGGTEKESILIVEK